MKLQAHGHRCFNFSAVWQNSFEIFLYGDSTVALVFVRTYQ